MIRIGALVLFLVAGLIFFAVWGWHMLRKEHVSRQKILAERLASIERGVLELPPMPSDTTASERARELEAIKRKRQEMM
jgi:hypothetical protein